MSSLLLTELLTITPLPRSRLMSHIYARSMGPAQLAGALARRDSLQATGQPVTFLMKVSTEQDARLAAASCDAWEYGCGAEVGIFALLDASDITVWDHARDAQDHHDPARSPNHLWIDNATQPLPFDRGLYVQSPEELAAILPAPSLHEAKRSLQALRAGSEEAVLEAAGQRARALARELEDFGIRQQQLAAMRGLHDELPKLLAYLGLPEWLLDVHPEHLHRDLRHAIDLAHQTLHR